MLIILTICNNFGDMVEWAIIRSLFLKRKENIGTVRLNLALWHFSGISSTMHVQYAYNMKANTALNGYSPSIYLSAHILLHWNLCSWWLFRVYEYFAMMSFTKIETNRGSFYMYVDIKHDDVDSLSICLTDCENTWNGQGKTDLAFDMIF